MHLKWRWICLSSALLIGMASAQSNDTLTLQEAIQTALKNNRGFLIAEQNVQKAEAQAGEARASSGMQVNGTGTYVRNDRVAKVQFGPQEISLGSIENRTARVTATQPIDISGTIKTRVRLSELAVEAARLDYERAKNDLILSVTQAYQNVARAEAFVSVAEEAFRNAQERLRITQVQVDAGVAAQFDLLRAQTQIAQNEQSLINARNNLELAKASLNNTLGRDLELPITVTRSETLPGMESELSALVQTAHELRPEIKAAEKNIELANTGVRNARSGMLPTFAVNGQLDFNLNTSTFNPRSTTFTATAVVSVPVFDNGITGARVNQAKDNLEIAKINALQIREGVALEVKNAYLTLTNTRKTLEVVKRGLEQAKEGLRLARVRFEAGVSTQLEISDAELAYTQAQTNEVNAQYDYLNAYAALQKAIGKIGENYL
ncbi:MAG: TolC family protein [Fimbriimonadia bacterium]|nr:TolC family protein [Fimbriimonadia bacterium]